MTNRLRCAIGISILVIYVGVVLFALTRRLLEPTPEVLVASIAPLPLFVAASLYACGWCSCFARKETTTDGYERMEMATALDRYRARMSRFT